MGWTRSVILGAVLICAPARAAAAGCWNEAALSSRSLGRFEFQEGSQPLGDWYLPISARRPDRPSEARVRVELTPSAQNEWFFNFSFAFETPSGTVGIPFSFQTVILSWIEAGQQRSVSVDWSEGCTAVGRSLFPAEAWSFSVALDPAAKGARVLEDVKVEIFGDRN